MSLRELLRDLDSRQAVALAAVMAAIWVLWPTWLVWPLKVLVVLFHELSHALAALVTGGRVVDIEVVARQGGLARTAGGSRFWILTAGYLGSLVWGGILLLLAARSRHDRLLTAALAAILLLAALAWVRPLVSFGFLFTVVAAAGLAAAAAYLPPVANDYLRKTLGLTSVLYAVLDIRDDVLARPHLELSDAAQLSRLTGLPTLFWGLLWMLVALAAAVFFVLLACRRGEAAAGTAAGLGG